MAQLTDDCFAFSGPLLPVEEVERIIRERVTPVAEIETVPLHAASGRVIAREVVAPIDLPPFDNSAVDGYAVRHADLDANAETRLAVVERVTECRVVRRESLSARGAHRASGRRIDRSRHPARRSAAARARDCRGGSGA